MENKQYKQQVVLSTFTINIESSLDLFTCLQANKYGHPVLAAFRKNMFLSYQFNDKSKSILNFHTQYLPDKKFSIMLL